MPRSKNSTYHIGNITRSPEKRTFDNGCVVNFGLAVNEDYQDNNGEWQSNTMFIDVSAWNGLGRWVYNNLDTGNRVVVEGKLQFEKWTDDSGEQHSKHQIKAHTVAKAPNFDSDSDQNDPQEVLDEVEQNGESHAEDNIPF